MTDSFYKIGSGHRVCQDYAVHTEDTVVLSDGCSSAANSDVGARILTHSYLRHKGNPHFKANVLGIALDNVRMMGLNESCLCATLMTLRKTTAGVVLSMIGDGCVVGRRRKDGVLEIFDIEFVSGAPFYLYYISNEQMYDDYISQFGDAYRINGELQANGYFADYPNYIVEKYFPVEDYDLVAMFSDGLNSFYKKLETETSVSSIPVNKDEILNELLNIKGFNKGFMERRCVKGLGSLRNQRIDHFDDFSVGVVKL